MISTAILHPNYFLPTCKAQRPRHRWPNVLHHTGVAQYILIIYIMCNIYIYRESGCFVVLHHKDLPFITVVNRMLNAAFSLKPPVGLRLGCSKCMFFFFPAY